MNKTTAAGTAALLIALVGSLVSAAPSNADASPAYAEQGTTAVVIALSVTGGGGNH